MNTKSTKTVSLLMQLAGSLLVGFSMGRWLAPLAAWVGPILILRFSREQKTGSGYILILVSYILAFLIGFGAIWTSWGIAMVIGLAVLYGFLWSLPYLADRLFSQRMGGFSSTFIYPLAAVTLEVINIHTNPVGDWGVTGHTQYGNLPLMQLASVTGMVGITFLMGWFATVINWAWENRNRRGEILRGLTALGAVLTAVYFFGLLRLTVAPISNTKETIRVAGITAHPARSLSQSLAELPDSGFASPAAQQLVEDHWDDYFQATVQEVHAGAKIVL